MLRSKKAAPRKRPARSAKKTPVENPERFVILLRHGIAEEAEAAKKDADRSLTERGHARMRSIARGLERLAPDMQAIYCSPYLRAVQTALWVAKAYRSEIEIR